ncbi:unnamed protein product, partial [Mesorhabditis spiculigera]
MINTIPKNHATRVTAVFETWAPHCDEHIFMTTARVLEKKATAAKRGQKRVKKPTFWVYDFSHLGNRTKPHDSKEWLWDRMRAAFKRVHQEKLNDFDWFLKADDDTFVIVENLKEFLTRLDPDIPYFVLQRHWLLEDGRDPNQIYGSGGAGYILSRAAVKKFIEIMPKASECRQGSYKHEDTEIGECLRNANVTFIDAADPSGRHSMLPINFGHLLSPLDGHGVAWAQETSILPLDKGPTCCSPTLISTHYVTPDQMYAYYFFVYKLQLAQRP